MRGVPSICLFTLAIGLNCCGPDGKVLVTSSIGGPVATYARQCQLEGSRQRSDVEAGNYTAATLVIEQWRGHSEQTIGEAELADALAGGQLRRSVLFARGGLGKTRLAASLRAQLCGRLSVYLVDAKDVAKSTAPGNPLIALLEGRPGSEFTARTKDPAAPILIMLDAIDEVEPAARERVVRALDGVPLSAPDARLLLLARPPILEENYGFQQVDARFSMRPLQCAQTDAFVAQTVRDAEERADFQRFLHRYGLDLKSESPTACSYPYMASYRDVGILTEFHKKATQPSSDILVSRSHAHEVLLSERLKKELENLGWSAPQALQLIDGMVRKQWQPGDNRSLRFDADLCIATFEGGAATGEKQRAHICERIFQSPIFEPVAGGGRLQLAGEGLVDLFLARAMDQELAVRTLDCKVALKHTDLLKSRQIFSFLIGQPTGVRCVSPLMDDRCSREPKSDQVEAIDDGLPTGRARAQIIAGMHAAYESTFWKFCTRKTLKSLDGTIAVP